MENETVYKPIVKKFLGYDVRVVQVDKRKEYIICKDMFNVLGLVKDDGTWTNPKNKMFDFLELINKTSDHQLLVVRVKDKHAKKGQIREVDCLNIETVPIVLTQFQPTKRRGEKALEIWSNFMKFVKVLLETHEVNKYIIKIIRKKREVVNFSTS